MSSIEIYDQESKRLQVLNQRFALLLNGLMFLKTKEANSNPPDLAAGLLAKRVEAEMTNLVRGEIEVAADAVH